MVVPNSMIKYKNSLKLLTIKKSHLENIEAFPFKGPRTVK